MAPEKRLNKRVRICHAELKLADCQSRKFLSFGSHGWNACLLNSLPMSYSDQLYIIRFKRWSHCQIVDDGHYAPPVL
jgi:hypothetical protein